MRHTPVHEWVPDEIVLGAGPLPKPTHSPAPWEVHDGGRFGQYGDDGPSICASTGPATCQPLFQVVGPADPKECEANTYLAAAAPKLLAACEDLGASIDTFMKDPAIKNVPAIMAALIESRAAIKEARRGG